MKELDAQMYEFAKLSNLGQSIAGRMVRYVPSRKEGFTDFIILEPAFVQDDPSAHWKRYGGAALGLSTDLIRKIDQTKVGEVLLVTFTDTKASTKGSPQKLFKVFILDQKEATALAVKGGAVLGISVPASVGAAAGPVAEAEDDDDLPF